MARYKMFADRCLTGIALLGIFALGTSVAYKAAGAAVFFGGYLVR